MRSWLVALALLCVPAAGATHPSCTPDSAPNVNVITHGEFKVNGIGVDGATYYIEDRGAVLFDPVFGKPIPFHSAVLDLLNLNPNTSGTWIYQEGNGVPGLQRGGIGLLGDWFPPGCDQNWSPLDGTIPCLLIDEDPINDDTCTHGPDQIITSIQPTEIL